MKKSLSHDFAFRYVGNIIRCVGIIVLCLATCSRSQAATYTWQTAGATNTWTTTTGNANWYVDSGTTYSNWANGNAAVFDNTTDATVTVTGTVAPTSVTIGASAPGAFTITGGTLAFGS